MAERQLSITDLGALSQPRRWPRWLFIHQLFQWLTVQLPSLLTHCHAAAFVSLRRIAPSQNCGNEAVAETLSLHLVRGSGLGPIAPRSPPNTHEKHGAKP